MKLLSSMTRLATRTLRVVSRRSALAAIASMACIGMASANTTPAGAPIRLALIEGLSGPLANTGEAVFRNLVWATERVNARGGVRLPGGARPLLVERFDSKGQTEEALSSLRAAVDADIRIVMQGNSSAAAAALIDAINKHNERDPSRQVLFLNYSASTPSSPTRSAASGISASTLMPTCAWPRSWTSSKPTAT